MAEQYPNNTPPPGKTVVTHETTKGDGARQYKEPERKKGFPWWILPLALIPLLFLAFRRDDDRAEQPRTVAATPVPVATSTPVAVASPDTAATGAATSAVQEAPVAQEIPGKDITVHKGPNIAVTSLGGASAKGEPLSDVVTFTSDMDPAALQGRKVKLTNANVGRVFNERAFLASVQGGQPMLVVLDQDMYATGGKTVMVKQGVPVSVVGIMTPAPSADEMQASGIPAAAASAAQPGSMYLLATVAQTKGVTQR